MKRNLNATLMSLMLISSFEPSAAAVDVCNISRNLVYFSDYAHKQFEFVKLRRHFN